MTTNADVHPLIYRIILGGALIWVLLAWALFSGGGYTAITLAVVTIFTAISVGIPLILWRIWKSHPESHPQASARDSFGDWLGRDVEIWGSRLRAKDAIAGVLIPFGAVILGAILIGMVFSLSGPPH
jgi:hypothetical protein